MRAKLVIGLLVAAVATFATALAQTEAPPAG